MNTEPEIVPIPYEDSIFLENVYSKHSNYMFKAALAYTKNYAKAEDIMHDAVMRLIANVDTLKQIPRSKIRAYVRVTVKATYLDSYRKEKRCLSLSDEFFQNVADREQELEPDLFLRCDLEELKKNLLPRDWIVLEGKFILRYSNEAIADLVGISPDSVRMTLSRIYVKSRKILHVGV